MSITASTPSKRIALAPININAAAAASHKDYLTVAHLTMSLTRLLPLTLATKSFDSLRSSPKLHKFKSPKLHRIRGSPLRHVNLKSSSFADYKICNSKNATADLAATKLKLKLQLALYKVKRAQQHNNRINIKSCTSIGSTASKVAKTRTPDSASSASFNMSTNLMLTPPSPTKNYQASVNINLQTKLKNPSVTKKSVSLQPRKTSLDAVATNQKLLLFQIKQSSSFYNSAAKPPLQTSALPSINKILKTPIKASRSYHDETTIDEDDSSLAINVRKRELLSSSPLKESFGTPNSFLVAKSLLQLGLGYY